MENRNIYKMDDVLIILSYLMLIPTAFFAWPWLRTLQNVTDINAFLSSAPMLLGTRLNGTILYAAGAVSTQFVGRVIRYKEKQSLKILDAIKNSGKTSVDQLAMTCGMSASRVRSLVKKLARITSLNISLKGDIVQQGSRKNVSYERPVYQVRKPASGSSQESRTDADAGQNEMPPELEAIMKDKSVGMMQKLKKLQEYGRAHPEVSPSSLKSMGNDSRTAAKVTGEGKSKKFHIVLFVILFLSPLWPVALIYAIYFAVSQNKIRLSQGDSVKPE